MGEVVRFLAAEEPRLLVQRLTKDERKACLVEKEWKNRIKDENGGKGTAKKVKRENKGEAKKKVKFSASETKKIDDEVEKRRLFLNNTLSMVCRVFSKVSASLLESKFHVFALHVAGIAKEHPYIKWGVRLAFHDAAYKIGKTPWDVERMVWHQMYFKTHDSVDKLKKLAAVF
jgi:hypothetical protein